MIWYFNQMLFVFNILFVGALYEVELCRKAFLSSIKMIELIFFLSACFLNVCRLHEAPITHLRQTGTQSSSCLKPHRPSTIL